MAATTEESIASSDFHSDEEAEQDNYEYEDIDMLDDPEALWNKYLKGVRLHDSKHSSANKSNSVKQKNSLATTQEIKEPNEKDLAVKENEVKVSEDMPAEEPAVEIQRKRPKKPERTEVVQPELNWNDTKKLRMRTASDVISRIRWDEELPAENFVVGYLDRFSGLVEKPFHFFSWDDLASVDYDVLAVPKHRIVYFKYRDQKIWDKNERLDLIFGSTESCKETDIRELIHEIDLDYEKRQATTTYDDNSDDESDDIQITIPNNTTVTGLSLPKNRPNYFVAVRITDPQVMAKAAEVKQRIIAKDNRLYDFLMPDAALHITLAMLKLDSVAEISTASKAIESCRESLSHFFDNPIPVQLEGLSTFNGYVLYSRVIAPPAFYELQKSLIHQLALSGVQLAHEHDYVPHMTILKLTKSRARVFKSPYIDPYVYIDDANTHFGIQSCDNLQLCVIGEEKRWDGFYNCAAEVYFA